MESIKQVLMRRDGISAEEANDLIDLAKDDLHSRLNSGEYPDEICAEWFGLEPDYIMELVGF